MWIAMQIGAIVGLIIGCGFQSVPLILSEGFILIWATFKEYISKIEDELEDMYC